MKTFGHFGSFLFCSDALSSCHHFSSFSRPRPKPCYTLRLRQYQDPRSPSFFNNGQMMSLSCCALSKWELFILRLVLLHHIKDLLCAYFFRWTLSSILCSLHDSSKPCIIVVLFLFSIVFVTEPFCGLIEPNNTICSIKLLFWSKLPQRGKLVPKQNM